ncbi:hypothetical protein CTAYLR_009055 [Chrysophaeum taylorii]|uniref:Uncharacterized protein n=1 Tax=Chrysophaeum taylorii TaxID=2483200 RepID=A0AAD7UCC6_9STRA|nr:hypothetical protein CTAYLR_009055 [Chrysophaeum taylorii]
MRSFAEEAQAFCELGRLWHADLSGWAWDWRWVDGYIKCRHFRRHGDWVEWEFHILPDETWGFALYARACRVDGSQLRFGEAVRALGLELGKPGTELVSQEQHPILGEPFLVVHTCTAQEKLDLLGSSLLTWFHVTGPVLGLKIHPRQWLLLRER